MNSGAIVVTPNNRLSNQLLRDFFYATNSDTSSVKDKPHCLPYQAFLHWLFKQIRHQHAHVSHPNILTQQQQCHLWRQILKHQADNTVPEGLLQGVRDAWARCQLWQIAIDDPAFSQNPQTRQFQQWQQQFQNQLDELQAITEEQLANYVQQFPDGFNFPTIIWACFDDYTPQQHALQKAIENQGCQQYHYDLAVKPITTQQFAAKDTQDETLQMIHWLKQRLAAGEPRIGVVVPDLQNQSTRLQRQLQRHIPKPQFSISLGGALADYPLVTHALCLLGLHGKTISNHHARLLLLSPYLAGAKTELVVRAQLMQDCKLLQEAIIPLPALIKECSRVAPIFSDLLKKLIAYPQRATPYEWITHFKTRLHHFGFPGEYPLQSSAYQYFQRLIGVLDELLPLAVLTPLMREDEALEALSHLTKTTIFQIRKAATPIQVLGLLEASGCTFDSVWICGLTDQCLPQKTSLSAFIPASLQRDKRMPHAIPARELQFARQMLQRLQHGSGHSVFSYPRMVGDIPNMPSPLIANLPLLDRDYQQPATVFALINVEEAYDVAFTASETISGGTAILANQAKCPFRAFAAHRLHAKSSPKISTGPDASERGQIIHKVMDILWRRIGSQPNLLAMSHEQLDELIEQAILDALAPFVQLRNYSFSSLVQEVELSRLKYLVHACLEWDKQRTPFVVEAVEQAFTINLAGIDFKVRVDRLDRVGNNKWVIDYKSRLPTSKPWYEERPEEPQLLLYALLDETINVLLFLQLRAGHLVCSGISEDELPIKGISTLKKNEHWADQQQQWKTQLTRLASEFGSGYCPPTPNRETTCQYCDFQSLCRIELS